MKVYLDNAATTPLAPEVCDVMVPLMRSTFGNPSSTHQFGREAKAVIEQARRDIAGRVGAHPSEIFFTSGGTEADNMAIQGAVRHLGVQRLITSEIEHHAVTHTADFCRDVLKVPVDFVRVDAVGRVDLNHLRSLLENDSRKTLVSLMHANNEIGTLNPIEAIGDLCEEFGALYHCDTVQTLGHLPLDLGKLKIHFAAAAAHKFHGPKGVGFLYVKRPIKLPGLLMGGAQERSFRAGTENVYGIAGMAKALCMSVDNLDSELEHIRHVRGYMAQRLGELFPGLVYNGCQNDYLCTVLNVTFPDHDNLAMLPFLLDMDGIALSTGSACSSGSNQGSHVIRAIRGKTQTGFRFSFSRYSTTAEVDYVVERLREHLAVPAAIGVQR